MGEHVVCGWELRGWGAGAAAGSGPGCKELAPGLLLPLYKCQLVVIQAW